jgi:hypothetical protein
MFLLDKNKAGKPAFLIKPLVGYNKEVLFESRNDLLNEFREGST